MRAISCDHILNLRHCPTAVTKIVERIPLADASFSSIVSTFTLCSIPDVERALAEIRRVLTPDGRFWFVEHSRAARAVWSPSDLFQLTNVNGGMPQAVILRLLYRL